MINVFDYADYRLFLKDAFAAAQKADPKFSYRVFARRAGVSSASLLSDIIARRRRLSERLIPAFARGFGLKRGAAVYFDRLVHFNQAKKTDTRLHWYKQMQHLQKVKVDIVGRNQYEFYSRWYYSAIRVLLFIRPFKDDYKVLARQLRPPIKPKQAEKAVTVLLRLGLIKRDKKGLLRPASVLISTGPEFRSLNAARFNAAMIQLSMEAIDRHKAEHRDMSTLTLTLSRQNFIQATQEIELLRKRLMKLANDDELADRVYQMNFHVFPLSIAVKRT